MATELRTIDDLLLHLKGLVLVRELREQRGAEDGELRMYGEEIERVRRRARHSRPTRRRVTRERYAATP